jgi:hypothetical protein
MSGFIIRRSAYPDLPQFLLEVSPGFRDSVTSPESRKRIATTLSNAHLVVLPAKGHDANVPNPARRR